MDSQTKKENLHTSSTTGTTTMTNERCTNPRCFFCILKEPNSSIRRAGIVRCFKEIQLIDDEQHILVLSALWNIAMTHPNDTEFPSLGIFECMASLLSKGINDRAWLLKGQNIYIPYYAAHVIGSYTMNEVEIAEKAAESSVIPPLLELMRGKMSWVEQRVAVRALGHLASYDRTFEDVAKYEKEVVKLAMNLASTCIQQVFDMFVGEKNEDMRSKYQGDLLTRGIGGLEMQNRKAEEWASQIQCWSLHLLNCFAIKERSIDLICRRDFLKELCGMWGGLVNHTSPAGIGLIRILCYTKIGRIRIAECKDVIENLCNLSRSSDDWQYMGIDCLLLLLKDPETRYKVIDDATLCLVDLAELRNIAGRSNLGENITRTLLRDFMKRGSKIKNDDIRIALEDVWVLKIEKRRKEKFMSDEKIGEKRVMASLTKQQGNRSFLLGDIEGAVLKYTEGLELCPLRLEKERTVLYSNRAQCHLMLGDIDSAISDATRALSLTNPPNLHSKSLWRRSQAYDMKGLAKESLMDCLMFINSCYIRSDTKSKDVKIPYYVMRMINKQMDSTCLFAAAQSKTLNRNEHKLHGDDCGSGCIHYQVMGKTMENKGLISGLSTISEEPFIKYGGSTSRRKQERAIRRKKSASARSTEGRMCATDSADCFTSRM